MKSVFDGRPFDPRDAIESVRNGVLLDQWMDSDSPCRDFPREAWIAKFREIGYTSDGWPAKPRTKTLRLMRGCRIEDQRGLSWTPSYYLAEWFAKRSRGDIWVCNVPADRLLARIGPTFGDQRIANATEFVCDVEDLNVTLF